MLKEKVRREDNGEKVLFKQNLYRLIYPEMGIRVIEGLWKSITCIGA